MPAHRKSKAEHLLAGTFRKDRHHEPLKVEPIDPTPPPHLEGERLKAWTELVHAGERYLAQSDRFVVELAAGLLARVRAGEAKAADYAQLQTLLTKMGLNPTGRRGLEPVRPDSDEANPFDRIDHEAGNA